MAEPATTDSRESSSFRGLAHRRPITMFLVIVLGLLPVDAALLVSGQDISPGILLSVILLLGVATLVTALVRAALGAATLRRGDPLADGPRPVLHPGDRHATADAAGRRADRYPQSPAEGWLGLVGSYLFRPSSSAC